MLLSTAMDLLRRGQPMSLSASHPFVIGSAVALASTFSVGPTNLMMIREGIAGGRVVTVPAMVVFCYASLLALACAFAENVARCPPDVKLRLTSAAVGTLLAFAARSFWSALGTRGAARLGSVGPESRRRCLARVALVVLLNPLVYIEVLLVPASICAMLRDHSERLLFAAGLGSVTLVYSFAYSFGARLCAPLLGTPGALRCVDLLSGFALFAAASLTLRGVPWSGP